MTIKAILFDAYGTLYDVQSVVGATELAFPGFGSFITPVWRMKQLEYTWLRSMMGRYEDFWAITKESLAFTLELLGVEADAALLGRIAEAYNTLAPYPDARPALQSLAGYRLAILSNGSPDMLRKLVDNSGLGQLFEAILSVDEKKTYKPDPRAYRLVEEHLGVAPAEVLFVSANGFDLAGAKSFGFAVARIERLTKASLRAAVTGEAVAEIGPGAMFNALRGQIENIGASPDYILRSLLDLTKIL